MRQSETDYPAGNCLIFAVPIIEAGMGEGNRIQEGTQVAIALAGSGLEFFAIDNAHFAASVLNDAVFLQESGRQSDRGAASAEHNRQEFVSQDEHVAADQVL